MRVKDPAALRRKRKNRGFSQTELAFLVRRGQQTVSFLETGRMKTLSEDLAVSIAARLDVDWEDLFELEEHEVIPKVAHESSSTTNPRVSATGRSRKTAAA